jgi:polysaccharide export outer membrane protein
MRRVAARKADGQDLEKGRTNARHKTEEYYVKHYSKVTAIGLVWVFLLAAAGTAYAQVSGGAPAAGLYGTGGPLVPQAITIPGTQPGQVTPAQAAEAMQLMTPAQSSAVEPQAIEALKARPEFQSLSPEEIAKGKELLEEKEKVPEKKGSTPPEKTVIQGQPRTTSLFDRYRVTGRYQAVSTDLRPFGYAFFNSADITVATDRKDVPVPARYVIGPGDEVRILMWGRVNAQHNLVVDRNGNIAIPQVGPLHIAGLTFEQMAGYLIKQSEQIVGANIDITMGTLKSIPIFVLGDVKRPGAYTVGSFATITDALLIAGGPSEIGSMRNVQVRRKDKVLTTFDLYDLLIKGDKSKDLMLQAGDVVFVPVTGLLVGVAGNVRRPAIYELTHKNDLENLFDLAGGIIPTAYTQQIQVERVQKNERQIVVDIDDKNLTRAKEFHLQEGDLVKIFSIVDKDINVVFLNGNVKRPGKYEYKPGMRLKDLLKDPTDLLQETHFDYALIKRLAPPTLRPELIPFSLNGLLIENDGASNIRLMARDQVFVFSKWLFKDRPFVMVEGEVRKAVSESLLDSADAERESKKPFAGDFPSRIREEGPRPGSAGSGEEAERVRGIRTEEMERMKPDFSKGEKPAERARPRIRIDLAENMTIRDAITAAGGLTRDAHLVEAELYRTDEGTKKITLIRFDVKKVLDGDKESDLLLKDLDRIVVHSAFGYDYKRTVSVDGAVLKPGVYPYAENMRLKDLIFAAGNILESAYLDGAEVSSQVIVDDKRVLTVHKTVNLRKALAGAPEENLVLTPYDRVFVKRLSNWGRERFATISGEVRFPGTYVLKETERLSDVIERAGGYKETAYLRGAVFTRQSVKELQRKNLEEMIARMERELLAESSTVTSASTEGVEARKIELQQKQAFIASLKNLKATGRMTVRVVHVRLLKGSRFDIELENGDSLYIPMNNRVVNVMGAVMSNASLVYADKAGPKDYVLMAGGYSKYADVKNTYVLKVDGSARKLPGGAVNWSGSNERWELAGFDESERVIESGDTIVVPEKLERIAWLREIKDIAQIMASMATATGVVYLISRAP